MKPLGVLFTLGLALAASAAAAQPSTGYKLENINFDMWCQETKHYPPARCDQRLPEDNKEFEAYVHAIEKYELRRLKNQRQRQESDRVIMHGDPVDNPTRPSTAPVGAEGTIPNPQ
jgi:hypothetical protein